MKPKTPLTPKLNATTGAPENTVPPVTVAGAVPPALAQYFQVAQAQASLPEVSRLPRPGERCRISGCSRTWLVDTDAALPAAERFLFRVRQRGKMRGAVFVNVSKLLAFLHRAEAENLSGEEEENQADQ